MPGPQYSIQELHALRQSPLVKKPDNLPNIEQWFEAQTQRQPRAQEQDTKQRGGATDTRSARYNPTGGEDVFLGPKMSFASASSAARQPRTSHSGNNAGVHEGEEPRRTDRIFGGRARMDQDRPRRFGGDMNGDSEGRSRFSRARESVDADDDRTARPKQGGYGGGEEGNGQGRRNGMGRGGKFDQPWLRGVNRDTQDTPLNEGKLEWRGSRQDHPREEESAGWTMPSATNETMGAPSMMENFQKWKEQMKAGKDAPESKVEEPATRASKQPEPETSNIASDEGVQINNVPKALFGIYGADESDTPPPAESAPSKATVSKKSKASRFAKMFQPSEPSSPAPAAEPAPPQSPAPADAPSEVLRSSSTTEDRAGFENMMRMLTSSRVSGGPAQQANANALFSALAGQGAAAEPRSNRSSLGQAPPSRGPEGVASPFSERPHPVPTPPAAQTSRPQAASRDSEFLLNLMKSGSASRTPFTEAQIYGQSYRRKGPEEAPPGLVGPSPPPRGDGRGPPPGFFEMQQNLAGTGVMDARMAQERQMRDRQQGRTPEPGLRDVESKEMHLPGFPGMDQQFPPGMGFNGGRPHSPQRAGLPAGVPPPPGFGGPNRGGPPPGFQFPPGFPPHMTQQGPGRAPPMMSPPASMGQGPPPFFSGPAPPGFAPPPGQQHGQSRARPPSGGLPPGFDMYGAGMNGRGPTQPPPGHGGYAQYIKQMNGGAYQGL